MPPGFKACDTALNDGDLLIEFALALAHIGNIDCLQGRRDIGKHRAGCDARTEPGEAAGRRRKPAADGRLNAATRVGSGMMRPGNSRLRR
jgi:hypothetical protein